MQCWHWSVLVLWCACVCVCLSILGTSWYSLQLLSREEGRKLKVFSEMRVITKNPRTVSMFFQLSAEGTVENVWVPYGTTSWYPPYVHHLCPSQTLLPLGDLLNVGNLSCRSMTKRQWLKPNVWWPRKPCQTARWEMACIYSMVCICTRQFSDFS